MQALTSDLTNSESKPLSEVERGFCDFLLTKKNKVDMQQAYQPYPILSFSFCS
jgi:hypothetical protein